MKQESVTGVAVYGSDAEVAAIGQGLLDRTLPAARWTHAAHLAAAAWLIAARPEITPETDMQAIIRAYNDATGVPNSDTRGYHETITQASLQAVRAYFATLAPGLPLYQACNGLLASPYADKGWLLRYWSAERLFSVAARRAWLAPDLAPLPF